MPNTIEAISETNDFSFGSIMQNGFSSLMDGVVQFGQLSIQDRLIKQFPEQFPPTNTSSPKETAINEQASGALSTRLRGFGKNADGTVNTDYLLYGSAGLAVLGLIVYLVKR